MNFEDQNLDDLMSGYFRDTQALGFLKAIAASEREDGTLSAQRIAEIEGVSDFEDFLVVASIALAGGIISPSPRAEYWGAFRLIMSYEPFIKHSEGTGSYRFWKNLQGGEPEPSERALTHDQARRFIELDREILRAGGSEDIQRIISWRPGRDLIEGELTFDDYLEGVRDPRRFVEALMNDSRYRSAFDRAVQGFSGLVDLLEMMVMNSFARDERSEEEGKSPYLDVAAFRYRNWFSPESSGALKFMTRTVEQFGHWSDSAPVPEAASEIAGWSRWISSWVLSLGKMKSSDASLDPDEAEAVRAAQELVAVDLSDLVGEPELEARRLRLSGPGDMETSI